LIVFMIP